MTSGRNLHSVVHSPPTAHQTPQSLTVDLGELVCCMCSFVAIEEVGWKEYLRRLLE